MKYSILIPYCNRATLHNTLVSFLHHYSKRKDYEVIIIEDRKNVSKRLEHNVLLDIISSFALQIKIKHIETNFRNSWAPVRLFNLGAKKARGTYLMLTHPECFHLSNVLEGVDSELSKNPEAYVIAACANVSFNGLVDRFEDFKYKKLIWYQHSKHNNRKLNFCSVISKKLYEKIGGFDEGYAKGFGRDDVDFIRQVVATNTEVVTNDEIITAHMKHGYAHLPDKANLVKINREYYQNKWRGK